MSHRVLIVDDSLTVRMDLHDAFTADGFATLLCATGAEARAAFAADGFDAAVLDVLLPDADGLELLTELRGLPGRAGVVTVLLSTEDEVADRLAGLRTGADEYVGKPYDAGYVVARVRQLLSEPPAPAEDRVTVLIIDDSMTFREQLRDLLEAEGYAVLTAPSGEEGLRLAADRRPQAIIVDGNHKYQDHERPFLEQGYDFRPVRIGDGAVIMSKTTITNDIGTRAVIGANTLVTKPVPAYCLAVGAPARVVKYFGPPELRPDLCAEEA